MGTTRRKFLGGAVAAALVTVVPSGGAEQAVAAQSGRRIAKTALRYKGAPYKWGGNTPNGFDCSGFTQYVVRKAIGLDIGQSVPGQWRFGSRVAKGRWRAGDLVFFENTFEPGLSHVGIYLGNNRFIHAENRNTGVVIDDIRSDYYARHYYGARRLR